MMKRDRSQSEERRRVAQARVAERAQQAAEALKDRDRARAAESAKTTRLRALRLAKEARDQEVAATRPPAAAKILPVAKRPRKIPKISVASGAA